MTTNILSNRSFLKFQILHSLLCLSVLLPGLRVVAEAPPPSVPTFSHQGRLAVGGVLVNGSRQFKFLLFNRTGIDPDFVETPIWSNSGIIEEVREPETSVSVDVINGLYSVVIGDPEAMEPLPVDLALPADGKMFLRIWISGIEANDFFQLTPDQEITATPFALCARTIIDDSITSPKILDGEVTTPDIADGAVTNEKLAEDAVNGAKIMDGSIGTWDIASLSIQDFHLAAGSVTGAKIADGTITAADLGPNAVDGNRIVDGSITSLDLSSGSVTGDKIVDGTITAADLGPNAVDGSRIVDGSITSLDLSSNSVTGDKIVDGTITAADLGPNAVDGSRIVDGSITSLDLSSNSVDGSKIADGSVGAEDLATGAVGTAALSTASVTGQKLAANAVDGSHLLDSSITAADLQPGSVVESRLADAAVSTNKMADASITFSKFHPDTLVSLSNGVPDGGVTTVKLANVAVTTEKLADGSVAVDKLAIAAVTAEKLANGSVTAQALAPGAVTGLDHPLAGEPRAVQVLENGTLQVGTGTITDHGSSNYLEAGSLIVGGSHALDVLGSIVSGSGHAITAEYAVVSGFDHEVVGSGSMVTGSGHTVFGNRHLVSGTNHSVTGSESMAVGASNSVSGSGSIVVGSGNTLEANHSVVIGSNCHVSTGNENTAVFGIGNFATSSGSCVVGRYNKENEFWDLEPVLTVGDGAGLEPGARSNALVVAAGGKMVIGDATASNMLGKSILHENGAYLTEGGTWTNASDRNLKENIRPVNASELLDKVAALPISEWNYKVENDETRHVGPMAQDFQEAFGLGDSDKAISTVDASGVALAAIQALKKQSDEQVAALADRDRIIADLQTRMERLEQQLKSSHKAKP